tara:strand:+ start:435 stop:2627 length:2193 start_codon:yes stop_codon:yes gene_type:complete
MKKIIYRSIISLILIVFASIIYLSTIGVETKKFNTLIASKLYEVDQNFNLKINKVSVKLIPLSFAINLKTLGTNLIYKDEIIQLESIRSQISIRSMIDRQFALTELMISTKSIPIINLISLIRAVKNDPKLLIAEQYIENGFIIADLKLEFDDLGNIKKNYKFNGLVNDGEIDLFKKYNLNKINFSFEINEKVLKFNDIIINLNNNDILIPQIVALKKIEKYLVSGKLNTKNTNLKKDEINRIISDDFIKLDIQKISFSSKNNFNFEINKNFKVNNLDIKSDIDLDNFEFKNFLLLKNIFPNIRNNLIFRNQKLKLEYKNKDLNIIGKGETLLQRKIDQIEYEIYKENNKIEFKTKLKISKNSFNLDFLNYKKLKNSDLELNFEGQSNVQGKIVLDKISLTEKNNIIFIQNLILSKNFKIYDLEKVDINYLDKDNLKNNLELIKKNGNYLISGNSFNIKSIIDRLLNSDNDDQLKVFDKDFKIIFDVESIYLDTENIIRELKGFLTLNKSEILELNLESKFSNEEKIKFTIKKNGNEKVTTLYSYKAKPFVDRYKFIKGFEEGDLNFYSIKKNSISNSTLKIDNFKIQEIPVLAKLLTLASLQGIADLLTGEGIRFTDFEMKFSSDKELMTIEELYAIGPAISILMEGYIQSKKLISLRGTLVPATTINRTISSIPLIGDLLVGKKVGEGVFGVSFKIKGPPDNLETTVNPIKTLTPRFITRTLEKIKKN